MNKVVTNLQKITKQTLKFQFKCKTLDLIGLLAKPGHLRHKEPLVEKNLYFKCEALSI